MAGARTATPDPPVVWGPPQALTLLGADVVLTDVASVLPLLERNVETNISKSALRRELRVVGVWRVHMWPCSARGTRVHVVTELELRQARAPWRSFAGTG